MTRLTLTMPRLGETMEEGLIVGWMVEPGVPFKRGQPILELETDKTVVEFPALGDGMITEFLAGPGDRIEVGRPIATAEVASAADWADSNSGPAPAPEPSLEAQPAAVAPVAASVPTAAERLRATPLARRLARQQGVALESLTGTGRRGRIERADVESAGQTAQPGESRSLDLPGGRLSWTVSGEGGETFLLIHGFAGDRSAWAQLSAGLARAGHSAIAPDLPGHGQTTLEAGDLASLAAPISRLAESLPGPVTLIGHSLGAAVATLVAGQLGPKVSRLVLLTPAGCGLRIGADFVHGMAGASSIGEVSHLLRMLGPKGGALSDAALRAMTAEMAKGRLRALAATLATPDGRQRLDILRPLARLATEIPVTAVFGTVDQIVSPLDALNLPPQVAIHFLPTGHMPQWDGGRDLTDLILKGGRDV